MEVNSCCSQVSPPTQLKILPEEVESSSVEGQCSAQQPTRLLDEALCSVPVLTSKEVRKLLFNLRDRQEQLFKQVLDQQETFQIQLVDIQSSIKANSDVHNASKQRQVNFTTEVGDLSVRQHDTAEKTDQSGADAGAGVSPLCVTSIGVQEEDNRPPSKQTSRQNSGLSSNPSRYQSKGTFQISRQASGLRRRLKSKWEHNVISDGKRERLSKVLQSKEFDIAISIAILINAFVMCWECQYQGLDVGFRLKYPGRRVEAHVVWAGAETAFICFDWCFGCLFLAEMIAKLACWRCHYFYQMPETQSIFNNQITESADSPSFSLPSLNLPRLDFLRGVQTWNLLDSICVMAFLLDKSTAAEKTINPQIIRLLRLFRLGRLVRLLRFIESLDHLYVMTTAIAGLKTILSWAIVLLTLMLLTCNLLLVQVLHLTYFDQVKAEDLSDDELKKYHEMYEYFGTCTRCMLSMFELTLSDWPPVARLLIEEVSEWFTLLCLVHKLTIGFAVVGVITGCILQETFKVAQTDDIIMFRQKRMETNILMQKMHILFEALDESHDGKLNVEEFEALGALPEVRIWLSSLNIETGDLHMLFDLIDMDGNGYITLEELQARIPRIQGNARSIDVLALQRQVRKIRKTSPDSVPGHTDNRPSVNLGFADLLLSGGGQIQ